MALCPTHVAFQPQVQRPVLTPRLSSSTSLHLLAEGSACSSSSSMAVCICTNLLTLALHHSKCL